MTSLMEKLAAVEAARENAPKPANDPIAPTGPRFDLDFDAIAARGGYTPYRRDSRLSLELRAIKRRLLRRLGFLRAGGASVHRGAAKAAPLQTNAGRRRNLILVTSTRAGEGKTFNAVNLALSFAMEDGIETLLIDADAPRPQVRAQFGLPPGPGLTDRLLDPKAKISDFACRANQGPLSILSEGRPVEKASALYGSKPAMRFWTELSQDYASGLVIIDAPPVLAATEAVILAKFVDEIVFVVEAGATQSRAVRSAVDELLDINPNVSLVLNRTMLGSSRSHFGSYHYYQRDEDESALAPSQSA